jgi:hypothetical protein
MALPRDKQGKAPREEFDADHTRQPGHKLRRKILQRQPGDYSGSPINAVGHGEDLPQESHGSPPQEDRAG